MSKTATRIASKALPAAKKGKADGAATRTYRHVFAKAMATHGAAVLAFSGLDVETAVSGAWAEAELRIAGPAAELAKAHKLLDAVEADALAAMTEYAATAEHRKGQTGYQRRVDSRRFIEGFESAVAARLAGKAPKGSKSDAVALRAGRMAGKRAELPAA
ncbi:hypothetical protein [Pimelobacter simplex]|uniref:hypothetical protein n=1 Tax=Nocardioides simplex TaxID=2045 RepID=UPI003AAD39D1